MDVLKRSTLSPSLLAEIKRLHFYTQRLADQVNTGQYRSAFRGRGIEFEEVREYVPGDEVRLIDWKVTARFQKPFIKSYHEERELTVVIAVDVSRSTATGTRNQLREKLVAQVASVLTLVALNNNDKVGLITFSDRLETYHPPRKARSSAWRILHEVLDPNVIGAGTDLEGMFRFIRSVVKRTAIVFVISDFVADPYETSLAALAKRHDVTFVHIGDPADEALPPVGLIELFDPESSTTVLVDSANPKFCAEYGALAKRHIGELTAVCRRNRVGLLQLSTGRPFIADLKRYFVARESSRSHHHHA